MTRAHRVARRVRPDRQGHGLLLMAAVWAVIGLGTPGTPTLIDSAWHQAIPELVALGAWIATAGFAAAAAWSHRIRPIAIGALIFMPAIRLVSYLTSWIVYLVPEGHPGYERGWLLAAGQALMIAFVFYVASDSEDTTVSDLNHILTPSQGHR